MLLPPPAIGNFLLGFAQFPLAIYQQRCQSCWSCWKQLAANFAQNLPFFIRSFAQSLLPLCWPGHCDGLRISKNHLLAPCQATGSCHPLLAAVVAATSRGTKLQRRRCSSLSISKMQNKFLMNIEVWNLNWLHLICGFIASVFTLWLKMRQQQRSAAGLNSITTFPWKYKVMGNTIEYRMKFWTMTLYAKTTEHEL